MMRNEIASNAELINHANWLRQTVFIDEQGVPKDEIFDELNSQATHIVIFDDNKPVATARLLSGDGSYRIGLVAVIKSRRGEDLGKKVMRLAIEHIAAKGGKEILLTAQEEVSEFYKKLGFVQCGQAEVFESGFVLIPMNLCL